jgi:hypothetical protein
MRLMMIKRSTREFFCNEELQQGDVVCMLKDHRLGVQMVGKLTPERLMCPIIGMSLHDVVDIDLMRTHLMLHKNEQQKGGKIEILVRGEVLLQFPKSWHLPMKQPLFVNSKTAAFTWRAIDNHYPLATTIGKQDKDGFCPVEVHFQ